jgi:hypothetical protein
MNFLALADHNKVIKYTNYAEVISGDVNFTW